MSHKMPRLMWHIAQASMVCFCAMPSPAFCQPDPLAGPPQIGVPNPFATPEAVQQFRDYIRNLELKYNTTVPVPADFWQTAPNITYWGYRFIESGDTYDVFFEQTYKADEIVQSLLDVANGIKDGGCSYYNPKNVRVGAIESHAIEVHADLEGKERACGDWPWGGGWVIDKGDISGNASVRLSFRSEMTGGPNDRYRGQMLANQPEAHASGKVDSIFGINTNSIVGQVLSAIANLSNNAIAFLKRPNFESAVDTVNVLNFKTLRFSGDPQIAFAFSGMTDGSLRSKEYREYLQKVTSLTWSVQPFFALDDPSSGLRVQDGHTLMNLSFKATLRDYQPPETAYSDADREIELIRSFSQPDRTLTVAKGDSLWTIAKNEYGNPRYLNFIAATNGLDRKSSSRLRIGQSLSLLPIYRLPILDQVYFVAPGDTLSSICRTQASALSYSECRKELRRANPTVTTSRIYALEPLKIPSLPRTL